MPGRGSAGPLSPGGIAALILLAVLLAPVPPAAAQRRPGRLRPPEAVTCDRDQLTLYQGRVVVYERQASRLVVEIATDWDTREQVTLGPPPGRRLEDFMLLRGRPFEPSDWARIETQPGATDEVVRVAAWVCAGDAPPLLDWLSPAEPPVVRPRPD